MGEATAITSHGRVSRSTTVPLPSPAVVGRPSLADRRWPGVYDEFKAACARARGTGLGPIMPPAYDADAAERRTREVLAEVENW